MANDFEIEDSFPDEEEFEEFEEFEEEFEEDFEEFQDGEVLEEKVDVSTESHSNTSGNDEIEFSTKVLNEAIDVLNIISEACHINITDMGKELLNTLPLTRIADTSKRDLLLASNSSLDGNYRKYLIAMMPSLESALAKASVKQDDPARAMLADFFVKLVTMYAWDCMEKYDIHKVPLDALKMAFKDANGQGIPYPLDLDTKPSRLALENTVNVNCNILDYLSAVRYLFEGLGKEEEVKKEEAPVVEEPHEYDQILDDTIQSLMTIYEKLYADCFVNIPVGVLTESGIVTVNSEGKVSSDVRTKIYATKFYDNIRSYFGFTDEYRGIIPDTAKEFLSHSYYPLYHLYNINGIVGKGNRCKTWKDFKAILHKFLKKSLGNLFATADIDYIELRMEIVRRLSDVIIVDEFNTKGMMSFLYHKTDSGNRLFFTNSIAPKMSTILGLTTGQVVAEPNLGYDVFKFMYVGDQAAYNKEILFAYKAYERMIESGADVSSKNIIIGKTLKDGLPYTANLASPQQIFTTILAGSGSGKGVLTLSLLAGLFAAGHPVAYIDYKPDMAAMLWNMERKIGTKIYAVDSLANRDKYGTVPVRNYEYGTGGDIYKAIPAIYEGLPLMPYLKSMQMACVMAGLRGRGADIGSDKKLFFVLDEAQQANDAYSSLLDALQAYRPPKAKKDEPSPTATLDAAVEKLRYVFHEDLVQGFRKCGNTTGRTGEVGFLIIGQATDPSAWKSGKGGDWKYSLFGFPIGKTSLKLMGRGIGRSSVYAITSDKLEGEGMLNNLGYWAVSQTASSGKDKNTVVVKSYMVLNENDYGKPGGFADSLLKNLDESTQNSVIEHDLTMDDGVTLRESVGFYGLMKMLCNNDEQRLSSTMGSMYTLAYNILKKAGILDKLGYSTVEEYLYSADPESFFTINQIIESYESGQVAPEEVKNVESLTKRRDEELAVFDAETENEKEDPDFDEEARRQERQEIIDKYDDLIREAEGEFASNGDKEAFSGIGNDFANPQEKKSENSSETSTREQPVSRREQPAQGATPFREEREQSSRQSNPILSDPAPEPVNQRSGFEENAYTEPLPMDSNPFEYMNGDVSSAYTFKQMSGMIMDEIKHAYGGFDRIRSVDISNSGLVAINNYKFMPQIPASVIETMPIDIQADVARGNIAELFYFDNLYKFTNLQRLSIESTQLAETRVRTEMGLTKKGWSKLFSKFHNLTELYIAGNKIGDENAASEYENNGRGGYAIKEQLSDAWNIPKLSDTWVGKLWNNPKAKHVKRGLGAVLGVKGLMLAASLFGPWGVFFGAVTVGSMYMDYKNKR